MSSFTAPYAFAAPQRVIMEPSDLDSFKESSVCNEIMQFCKLCAESIVCVKNSDVNDTESVVVDKIVAFMSILQENVVKIPPTTQASRFGNKSFRTWHTALISTTSTFLDDLLGEEMKALGACTELAPYLHQSFGNEIRIDYGTGHELNFVLFLLCLYKLELITAADLPVVICRGFVAYIKTMRDLQFTYMLEPAGSHGVWGLDDYHCLTFLFGAAQLCTSTDNNKERKATAEDEDNTTTSSQAESNSDGVETEITAEIIKKVTPGSVHNTEILEEYKDEFIYLEGIHAIKNMKKGAPFSEIAPMLYDISQMQGWEKILLGLMRLFQGEVLFKYPVIQHMLFGSILSVTPTAIKTSDSKEDSK